MPKGLRNQEYYIAPNIRGKINDKGKSQIEYYKETKTTNKLDLDNIDHRILIYENQVKGWFLNPAEQLTRKKNHGFIVLMICLAYCEGVEQYRSGKSSDRNSMEFFVTSLNRIYNDKDKSEATKKHLKEFYSQARCGLFHSGMTKSKIIQNNSFKEVLDFSEKNTIKVNPKKLLNAIKKDFDDYLIKLKTDKSLRDNFDKMYKIEFLDK